MLTLKFTATSCTLNGILVDFNKERKTITAMFQKAIRSNDK